MNLVQSSLIALLSISAVFCDCDHDQQKRIQAEYSECLQRFTNQHDEDTYKPENEGRLQELLCIMLDNTASCAEIWSPCHSQKELNEMNDMHILARLQQFSSQEDGVDIRKCDIVEQYLRSGKAQKKYDQSNGACTVAQVSDAHFAFQNCSQDLTARTWDLLRDNREYRQGETLKFSKLEVTPTLCQTLSDIKEKCVDKLLHCFSYQDRVQLQDQHIQQMKDYYERLYGFRPECDEVHDTRINDDNILSSTDKKNTNEESVTTTVSSITFPHVKKEEGEEDQEEEEGEEEAIIFEETNDIDKQDQIDKFQEHEKEMRQHWETDESAEAETQVKPEISEEETRDDSDESETFISTEPPQEAVIDSGVSSKQDFLFSLVLLPFLVSLFH